ncbi:MAG: cytochrome c family protein [Rhizobium sp.]|nr:cytochrome c family protein [Rhizobium sp.]
MVPGSPKPAQLRGLFRLFFAIVTVLPNVSLVRVLALFLVLGALAGCGESDGPKMDPVATFLKAHWQETVPPQGQPPGHFTSLEGALSPEACGTCHPDQFRDWQTALHSRTMGPGIYWQFEELGQAESNRCLRCHAPLAEQKALLAREMKWPGAPDTPPPEYVGETLHRSGLGCAACHLRKHVRYGPPAMRPPQAQLPHDGFVASEAFQDSRFCAHCHQFADDGPRLAGKLREDTFEQWRASSYAPDQPCQSCHMPERRHLWRGIHDPEMVRKAIEVNLQLIRVERDQYKAEVLVRNVGAGHHFPTYLVPKVNLILRLDRNGKGGREVGRDVIGWRADVNMAGEEFDTRIPAGGSHRYVQTFEAPENAKEWQIVLSVEVDPAEHYLRMFQFSLANVKLSDASKRQLERAMQASIDARFVALTVSAKP